MGRLVCWYVWGMVVGCVGQVGLAQSPPQLVQLYGFVMNQDSSASLFGAHIYHPKTKRGTSTNLYGYFSLPVQVGDTMRVSYQGFIPQELFIPHDGAQESYGQIILMRPDTILLSEVRVKAYLSAAEFRQTFLSMRPEAYLPQTDYLTSPSGVPRDVTLNYYYSSTQQQEHLRQQQAPAYLSLTDLLFKPLLKHIRDKRKEKK